MHIFEFFCWICYLLVLPRVVAQIRCLWPRVAADYHGGSSHRLIMASRQPTTMPEGRTNKFED
ncbi:hypothetical protein CIPAW_16G105600 [Carya illinoinensis]|uniref:Secreted protein n=1 Tax=Carya illinoinensis TaxID=32201 RepID=A0A8T1N2V8_CARIL|nr:hypothetical protein CIPAW_16G105600 [Carya illinoinensis]